MRRSRNFKFQNFKFQIVGTHRVRPNDSTIQQKKSTNKPNLKMKRFTVILLCAYALLPLLCAQNAPARVPAAPYPIDVVQPSGDTLTIRLIGDEWKHWSTTVDGYVIKKNNAGYYCYAITKRGEQAVGRRVAKNPEKRTKCDNRYLKKYGIKHQKNL